MTRTRPVVSGLVFNRRQQMPRLSHAAEGIRPGQRRVCPLAAGSSCHKHRFVDPGPDPVLPPSEGRSAPPPRCPGSPASPSAALAPRGTPAATKSSAVNRSASPVRSPMLDHESERAPTYASSPENGLNLHSALCTESPANAVANVASDYFLNPLDRIRHSSLGKGAG